MLLNNTEVFIQLEDQRFHCVMDVTMNFIGGKWKTVVLWYLRQEKKRFGELKALMPQITEKMLSIQLKQLEEDGLVSRTVFNAKPPLKVEYALTEFGQSLLPLLQEIANWGYKTGTEKGEIIPAGRSSVTVEAV